MRPKLKHKARELFFCFSKLNRRRIEHRPLQKADIIDEIKHLPNIDKSLEVIESVDAEWLRLESEKIKRRSK